VHISCDGDVPQLNGGCVCWGMGEVDDEADGEDDPFMQ